MTGGMDVDAAQTAALVLPYLAAAARSYGAHTLDQLRDDAVDAGSDATVAFARRLAGRLFGRPGSRPAIESAVADLAVAPDDDDTQAALRLQIRKALAEDAELWADIARMLTDLGVAGDRYTVTVTGSQGVQVGHHNTQTNTTVPPTG